MLRARILTATGLLAAFLIALFWFPPLAWIGLVVTALAVAAWEWGGLVRLGAGGRIVYAMAITVAGAWAAWTAGPVSGPSWIYWVAVAFWVVLAPIWLWERPTFDTPVVPLAAGVIALVPNAAALAELRDADPALLLAVMALVWISDTAAYFTGRRFGGCKLAPAISPGKTWEGVYGALAAVTVYAIGWLVLGGGPLPPALRQAPLGALWFIVLLIGLAAAGMLGDLLESQMKRQAGLKDSGAILPGHGGVLDRIDALLPVLPFAALLFIP